jgi:glycosyltransferase involved in cell wall biosynthesis
VIRTGFVEEGVMRLWLAAADLGLLVLRDTVASRGRWPGKLSEYLTGGVPMVVTEVGAAPAAVAAAGAALLSKPEPAAFADAAVALLADAQAREEMTLAARALAAGELGWRSVAGRLLCFYERWSGVPAGAALRSREGSSP